MALLETLSDNFDDNSFDTGLWTRSNASFVKEQNTRIEINTTGSSATQSITSVSSYSLVGSYGFCQVVSFGGSTTSRFGAKIDSSNYVSWEFDGGTGLFAFHNIAGTPTLVGTTTYNATNHKFLRIREASGTTFWDASTDGVSWNNLYSEANPITLTSVKFWAEATFDVFNSSIFIDNVNFAPSTTTTSTSSTSSSTSTSSTSRSTSTSSTSTSISTSTSSTSTSISTSSTSTSASTSSTSTSQSTSTSSTSTSMSTSSTSTSMSTSSTSTSVSFTTSTSSTSASTSSSTSTTSTSLSTTMSFTTSTSSTSVSTSSTSTSMSTTTTITPDVFYPTLVAGEPRQSLLTTGDPYFE